MAEKAFLKKVNQAIGQVRKVLGTEKSPCVAGDVPHRYEDKYLLAEAAASVAAASQVNCLAALGLNREKLLEMRDWSCAQVVSLHFDILAGCKLVRQDTREIEGPSHHTEVRKAGELQTELTSKVVTTVTEYVWRYDANYHLTAVRGTGHAPTDRFQVLEHRGHLEFKTTSDVPLYPEESLPVSREVDISWLLQHLDEESLSPSFSINRKHEKCHTPRQNPEVDAALEHFSFFRSWASQVSNLLESECFDICPEKDKGQKTRLQDIDSQQIFGPVLPLMLKSASKPGIAAALSAQPEPVERPTPEATDVVARIGPQPGQVSSALLGAEDLNALLVEERRTLAAAREALAKSFPQEDALLSGAGAMLRANLRHCMDVAAQLEETAGYVEGLIRKQLVAAIGKEVLPADLAEYMRFHNRRLLADAYVPKAFCYAVRRSEHHSPEGTLSIEQCSGFATIPEAICTCVARSTRPHCMQFPLHASASVSFRGDQYLHAWLSHRFSGQRQPEASLALVARAHQFSSMIVLIGRISSAQSFEPKYAAIVENKDELTIPLELSTIPTPKEFKDAISSLSPEQQGFAKAFRAMQVQSTLFGVLVIQIKPQLEKVLNLPEDSLTKEIKLTQDLMQLFTKYQIPTDLLSYNGESGMDGVELIRATTSERLEAVRGHVVAIQQMIEQAKQAELHERALKVEYGKSEKKYWVEEEDEEEDMDFDLFDDAGGSAPAAAAPPRAAAAPPAAASQPRAAVPQASTEPGSTLSESEAVDGIQRARAPEGRDYTKVAKEMEQRFEEMDHGSSLRPTIIGTGNPWVKKSQKSLLAPRTTSNLWADQQQQERNAAFDLLNALTKSGALPLEHASLHVVVAATHCFDRTITDTVVQQNVNPIERVERSTLIMASTIHQQPVSALLAEPHRARVRAASPMLFVGNSI